MTDRPDGLDGVPIEDIWTAFNSLPESERDASLERLGAEAPAVRKAIDALLASGPSAEAFFSRFASVVEAGADEVVHGPRLRKLNESLAGRYLLERELGRGGMATIYLARDARHDRQVALKVLRPGLAATLGSDRFLREIRITARLRHPHILPLYDSGMAGPFLYYVMPYEPGHSLRDRLASEGELPVEDTLRILRDVVDALAFAHERGIIHRDIKPENVLLSDRHAAVGDFGVARAVVDAAGDPAASSAGMLLGTPRCMAPEQLAGRAVDHRADIFAIGAIAWEMLMGRAPFTGDTLQAVQAAHHAGPPEHPSAHRADVPPELDDLIMRCLEKRPEMRWQRTDQLLARIEQLSGRPAWQGIDATPRESRSLGRIGRWLSAIRAIWRS